MHTRRAVTMEKEKKTERSLKHIKTSPSLGASGAV